MEQLQRHESRPVILSIGLGREGRGYLMPHRSGPDEVIDGFDKILPVILYSLKTGRKGHSIGLGTMTALRDR